ncbi:hypothetical protein D7V93_12530 [Corallococcus llansteffanensis]|uniref:HEAT repeat domain-containing protein n=1 Tax=Corallococcus llansteffanensis TaxID=2316731 RepID=A0A3A8PYL3_9BACT|nr:hypothetical protein D7V93_12530 [Corallococcus llansteffanensis]
MGNTVHQEDSPLRVYRGNTRAMAQDSEGFAQARERMGQHTIPELIELLESEDVRTRFLAEMCLRDATST